ncbi:hypothetical protein BDV29DRAFT_151100 [Aspergillus leporis]|uniref:DNA topoisomerase I catalytic core eukaryotic-type domain-containing protein n=1 Tax=Aspergillus leporis TaxID=41062 RepID=A0A5N5WV77_9EURO|nr:hypothetical protein BDV29DRAFT_151100 [Aspergillus leporis]
MEPEDRVIEKIKAYSAANQMVAVLCNDKRTVSVNHSTQMEKLQGRVKVIQYQRWHLKQQMLSVDPTIQDEMGSQFFELSTTLWIMGGLRNIRRR